MAVQRPDAQTGAVFGAAGYTFLVTPVIAMAAIGLLVLVLRWSSTQASLVERRTRPGSPHSYGVLVDVAAPGSYAEGEVLRRRLEQAGVRATLASTDQGPRLMVWPADERRARAIVTQPR